MSVTQSCLHTVLTALVVSVSNDYRSCVLNYVRLARPERHLEEDVRHRTTGEQAQRQIFVLRYDYPAARRCDACHIISEMRSCPSIGSAYFT